LLGPALSPAHRLVIAAADLGDSLPHRQEAAIGAIQVRRWLPPTQRERIGKRKQGGSSPMMGVTGRDRFS
jgi:hypothetical protein